MTERRNILKIRCSDGRSRKPDEVRGNFIHQIRLPGGILFPDLCAQQYQNSWKHAVVSKLLRRVQLFAVEVMVDLKAPDAIYVMSHNDCGAAKAIGFSDSAVKQAHAAFGKTLQEKFPNIPVYVMHELHSMCGEHHHGHETIVDAA